MSLDYYHINKTVISLKPFTTVNILQMNIYTCTIGEQYYRMSKRPSTSLMYRVDHFYPQLLSMWKGLPSKIDTAFSYMNGRTYFFSGSNFYRFNDVSFKV